MRLLADENVPAPTVAALRAAGWDVASVLEDHAGMSDEGVVALARRLGRVVVTFDSDIGTRIYHGGDPPPPGVVYLRGVQSSPEAAARVLLDLLALPVDEGQFVTYRNGRVRSQPMPGASAST